MSEEIAIIFVFLLIAQGAIVITSVIWAWVNYGICEHNLIRTILKSLRGFVWPIVLAHYLYIHWPAIRTRLRNDWHEVSPMWLKEHVAKSIPESNNDKPQYMPGDWQKEERP